MEDDINDFLGNSEAGEEPDTQDDWWDDLRQGLESNDVEGPEVPEKLADIVTKALKNKSTDETMKDLLESYPRPSNLPQLTTPRIHEGIWKNLEHEVKTFDLQLSKVGEKTTKAITGSVRLVERLTRLKDSIKVNSMRKELRELAKAQIDIIKVSALNL